LRRVDPLHGIRKANNRGAVGSRQIPLLNVLAHGQLCRGHGIQGHLGPGQGRSHDHRGDTSPRRQPGHAATCRHQGTPLPPGSEGTLVAPTTTIVVPAP
jgi:hypothetical protein